MPVVLRVSDDDDEQVSVAVPEVARRGLAFTLGVQARAIIDFGDRTQALLDTTNDPEAFVKHQFGEEKSYLVRAIIQTLDGKQIPVRNRNFYNVGPI